MQPNDSHLSSSEFTETVRPGQPEYIDTSEYIRSCLDVNTFSHDQAYIYILRPGYIRARPEYTRSGLHIHEPGLDAHAQA